MLKLPRNWGSFSDGFVVGSLFDQIESPLLQTDFAATIIRESLELMLTCMAIMRKCHLNIQVTGPLDWRIRDAFFTYKPLLNNKTVKACVDLGTSSPMVSVIVPAGTDVAMQQSLISNLSWALTVRAYLAGIRRFANSVRGA